ncbi:Cloroperoxidase [Mycena leptocephala]|nr:Cloroperoxidase [Mycena leptocephala]
MNLLKLFLFLATTAVTNCADTSSSINDHKWIAPKATDLRSPCPGLNTLANHGYLPRDGRNISIPMMLTAAKDAFNIGPSAILHSAKFGLLSGDDPITLNLDALKLHNLIEHDASLSRGDFNLGDNLHFNETIFTTLANANPELAISLATNPNITNTPKENAIRVRESGLYLSVMGNPLTGVAPKKFVQIFFREERLPIAEGWKKPTTTITADTLSPIQNAIGSISNWKFTQRCEDLVLGPDLTI